MLGENHNLPRIFLLTGPPGCGKTTLVRRLVESLGNLRVAGFLTEEIRESGRRQGFMARAFDGRSCILAHRQIRSSRRVGAYGVDLTAFEREIVTNLETAELSDFFVIDEIGKMELKSTIFSGVIQRLVDGDRPLLATVPLTPLPLVKQLIHRPDTLLVRMDQSRRAAAAVKLIEWCIRRGLGLATDLQWAKTY